MLADSNEEEVQFWVHVIGGCAQVHPLLSLYLIYAQT